MNEALFCDKRFYELIITLSQRESLSSSYHFRRKLGLNTILRFDFSQNFQKFQIIVSKIISNQSWLRDGIFFGISNPKYRSRRIGIGIFKFGLDQKIPKIPKARGSGFENPEKIPSAKSWKAQNPGDRDLNLKIPKNRQSVLFPTSEVLKPRFLSLSLLLRIKRMRNKILRPCATF